MANIRAFRDQRRGRVTLQGKSLGRSTVAQSVSITQAGIVWYAQSLVQIDAGTNGEIHGGKHLTDLRWQSFSPVWRARGHCIIRFGGFARRGANEGIIRLAEPILNRK